MLFKDLRRKCISHLELDKLTDPKLDIVKYTDLFMANKTPLLNPSETIYVPSRELFDRLDKVVRDPAEWLFTMDKVLFSRLYQKDIESLIDSYLELVIENSSIAHICQSITPIMFTIVLTYNSRNGYGGFKDIFRTSDKLNEEEFDNNLFLTYILTYSDNLDALKYLDFSKDCVTNMSVCGLNAKKLAAILLTSKMYDKTIPTNYLDTGCRYLGDILNVDGYKKQFNLINWRHYYNFLEGVTYKDVAKFLTVPYTNIKLFKGMDFAMIHHVLGYGWYRGKYQLKDVMWVVSNVKWFDKHTVAHLNNHPVYIHHHTLASYIPELKEYDQVAHPSKYIDALMEPCLAYRMKSIVNSVKFELPECFKNLPEEYRFIKNSVELEYEGDSMHHCVGGSDYQEQCATGETVFFHYDDGSERGLTVEVCKGKEQDHIGKWYVNEIEGFENNPPKDEFAIKIREDISRLQLKKVC